MDTCLGLSRGQAFFQISEMFRNYLRLYGDYLMAKLPRSDPNQGAKGTEPHLTRTFIACTCSGGCRLSFCFILPRPQLCGNVLSAPPPPPPPPPPLSCSPTLQLCSLRGGGEGHLLRGEHRRILHGQRGGAGRDHAQSHRDGIGCKVRRMLLC
jgi:hypothetical protein